MGTSGFLGTSQGLGILVVTFVVRAVLIPVTYPLAVRSRDRRHVFQRIRPELQELKKRHKGDPDRSLEEIQALHERSGISVVDKAGALNALIQLPILIAFFQAVLHLSEGTSLEDGGLLLGVVAGALGVVGTKVGGQTDSRLFLAVAAVLPVGISVWLGAGIGYYLVAFYGAQLIQGVLVHRTPLDLPPAQPSVPEAGSSD